MQVRQANRLHDKVIATATTLDLVRTSETCHFARIESNRPSLHAWLSKNGSYAVFEDEIS